MSKKVSKFRELTNQCLEERLQSLLKGQEVEELSVKMFFYKIRDHFFSLYPTLSDIDISPDNNPEGQLRYFFKIITHWIQNKIKEINSEKLEDDYIKKGLDPDALKYWGIFRRELRIMPIQRAFCFGFNDSLLLEPNITKIRMETSILILIERDVLGQKIQSILEDYGYNISVISTQGIDITRVAEVIETLILINEDAKEGDKKLVIYVHDLDLNGITRLLTLQEYYPQLISGGINPQMLQHLKLDVKTIQEPYSMKIDSQKFKDQVRNIQKSVFSKWISYVDKVRVDLEAFYIKHGIDIFIQYINYVISLTNQWNLLPLIDFPSEPNDLLNLQERYMSIWEFLLKKILKDNKWSSPINDRLEEIEVLLKNYKGEFPKGIQKINSYIAELQTILDDDETNKEYCETITKFLDKMEQIILEDQTLDKILF